MQVLKNISRYLLIYVLSLSFVLAPFPSFITKQNIAYAECSDQPSDDGVYRPGCQFNKDLAKTDAKSVADLEDSAVKKIAQQYVGAIFAMIGISAIWKPLDVSEKSCPINKGAKLSFPIVAAGSLSYLLGEIKANAEFRKASKIAVDKNFAAKRDTNTPNKEQNKKNLRENDKQVEAYHSLIKIYKSQVNGLDSKIKMATLAQTAYLSAFGVEAYNMYLMKTKGTAAITAAVTTDASNRATLNTQIMALENKVPGFVASCPQGGNCSCSALVPILHNYQAVLNTQEGTKKEAVNSFMGYISRAISTKIKYVTKAFIQFAVNLKAATSEKFKHVRIKLTGSKEDLQKYLQHITKSDGKADADKTTRKGIITSVDNLIAGGCPAGSVVRGGISKIEIHRTMAIHCTGIGTYTSVNFDSTIPRFSTTGGSEDGGAVNLKDPSGASIKLKQDYFKKIVNNFYHRILYLKLEKLKDKSPLQKQRWFANNSQYINHFTENLDFKQLKKNMNLNELPQKLSIDQFANYVGKLIVKEAHAKGGFKDLLGLTAKVFSLYYFLGDKVRKYGFPTPKSRTVLWGIMAGVNAMIISFDKSNKVDAEKRLKLVEAELEKFIARRKMKTSFKRVDDGLLGKLNLEKYTPGTNSAISLNGIRACAVPKGNSFAPAVCPSKIPKSRFQIEIPKELSGLAPAFRQSTAKLGNLVRAAATTASVADDTLVGGSIAGVERNNQALRSLNDKLIDKVDKLSLKEDKITGKKRTPLKRILANFKKIQSKNASNVLSPAEVASLNGEKLTKEQLESIKKLSKKQKTGLNSNLKINNAKTGSDISLDMHSDQDDFFEEELSAESSTQSLEDFEVSGEDINNRKDQNIFKLISNRYLMSYPVLLDEKAAK